MELPLKFRRSLPTETIKRYDVPPYNETAVVVSKRHGGQCYVCVEDYVYPNWKFRRGSALGGFRSWKEALDHAEKVWKAEQSRQRRFGSRTRIVGALQGGRAEAAKGAGNRSARGRAQGPSASPGSESGAAGGDEAQEEANVEG